MLQRIEALLIVILLAVMMIFFPAPQAVAQEIIRLEPQIDHLMLAVRDLEAARRLFVDTLGFREGPGGHLPGGRENFILGFSDTTYLEPITVHNGDTTSKLGAFLSKHEGAPTMAIRVSSIEQTATFLKKRGFAIAGPLDGRASVAGSDTVAIFRYVIFTQPVLPNGLFFIEYNEALRREMIAQLPPERRNFTEHPNTANRLHAVWVAVEDLKPASDGYKALGFTIGEIADVPHFDASARPVLVGENGRIMLLRAASKNSPVAAFIETRGEGIMGVSVAMGNLDTVLAAIHPEMRQQLVPYSGVFGRSVRIPAARAFGLFIQMVAR